MEKVQKDQQQELEKQDERSHNNLISSSTTLNPPLSPPSSAPPSPPKTQSPPLDSPHGSNHSSDVSSLSHLSSPHEKPQSLTLSNSPVVIPIGSKPQDGEVHTPAQEKESRGGVIDGGVGYSGRRLRPNLSVLRKSRRENIRRRALLGTRVLGFLFCLVSFSVLAADKNQGWALDSFYRYKEFRYSIAVNVMGFAYSGLQACDLTHTLTTGKPLVQNRLRLLLDFSLDQILAYLLLSGSSSANFRVDDWESNWGKDKFPTMARVSLAFSYLAFLAFASSSLLSGYTLLTSKSR